MAALAGSFSLTASGEYLLDNTVFSRRSLSISAQGLSLPFGTVGGEAAYGTSALNGEINGLRAWDDEFVSAAVHYRYHGSSFSAGADLSAGGWPPGNGDRSFAAGILPVEWRIPGTGFRFLTKLVLRQGAADDNPAAMRIGIDKRTVKADAGLGFKGWELHASWQTEKYSAIPRADYLPLLWDTAFFRAFYDILNPVLKFIPTPTAPLPGNEIREVSVYGFGPVNSMIYAGGSYVYRNAREDLYLPVADDESGRIVNAFFPYITPRQEKVFFLIAAFARQWNSPGVLLNSVFAELDFPAYASGVYRGYNQVNPQNLLAGLDGFFYKYNGLGTMTLKCEIGKRFGNTWNLSLHYQWFSRPYLAYHYFGDDSYQYHTIKISLTKEL